MTEAPREPDPQFQRIARPAIVVGCLAFPLGIVLTFSTIGFVSWTMNQPPNGWLALAVLAVVQASASLGAIYLGIWSRRVMPAAPTRRERLVPWIGIGAGLAGAVIIGGFLVFGGTEFALSQQYQAAHEMRRRSTAEVIAQLDHRESTVRAAALDALKGRTEPEVWPAMIGALERALAEGDSVVMDYALYAMRNARIPAGDPAAVPVLARLVRTYPLRLPGNLRHNGWYALAAFGAAAAPALVELAADENFDVRCEARGRMRWMLREDATLAATFSVAVQKRFDAADEAEQERLLYACMNMPELTLPARGGDTGWWHTGTEPGAWIAAAAVLHRPGDSDPVAQARAALLKGVAAMLTATAEGPPEAGYTSTRMAAELAAAPDALPRLIAAVQQAMERNPEGNVGVMLTSLQRCPPEHLRPLLPGLIAIIDVPPPAQLEVAKQINLTKVPAMELLAHLGPAAAEAVIPLERMLHTQLWRREAIQTLGAIGPLAAPALPKLRELAAATDDPDVAKAAQAAVAKIESQGK